MAIRFLETNYYKSPFVRGLKGALKGLYSFIICDCTPSGIWAKDIEAASLYIGFNITEEEFNQTFVFKSKAIDVGGGKYFFPDFVEHQYPSGLQSWNKAHNKIIFDLNSLNILRQEKNRKLIPEKYRENGILYYVDKGALKGLQSPLSHSQGQSNGQSNGQGHAEKKTLCPEMLKVFKKHIPLYRDDSERDFEPLLSIGNFLYQQGKLEGGVTSHIASICDVWELTCIWIASDHFYSQKSLKTISNHIQEIINKTQNGTTIKKPINGNNRTAGAEQLVSLIKGQINTGGK